MSKVQAKQVVKYVVMPGVVPRFQRLFSSGFGRVAYLMAQIYAMVRLLPAHHPYLDPSNIGKFGIHHVIAAAANNLVMSKKNMDQILVFVLLLVCIVLLALQIIILVGALLFGSSVALAGAVFPYPEGPSIFVTGAPADDIAFMLLDRVFGVPGFFNSCVATGAVCTGAQGPAGAFPWPFHIALHQLFRFYSTGMLLIGTVIFLYFIVVIVAETATSGTPFGQRFQNVWVPIRLVVAIGLLVPLPIQYPGGGVSAAYNSGQYIVFAAAKYGSSLATNAWIRFNNTVFNHAEFAGGNGVNPLGERQTLVALPKQPDAAPIAEMISMVHTCAFTYFMVDRSIRKVHGAGAVGGPVAAGVQELKYPETQADIDEYITKNNIRPYLVKTPASWMVAGNGNPATGMALEADTSYQDALEFFYRGDIVITFGRLKKPPVGGAAPEITPDNIEPACGEIRIPVTDPRDSAGGAGAYPAATTPYLGAVAMQQLYFNYIRWYWYLSNNTERFIDFAGRFVLLTLKKGGDSACEMGCQGNFAPNPNLPNCTLAAGVRPCEKTPISAQWKQDTIDFVQTDLNVRIVEIWNAYNNDGAEIALDPVVLDRGWGGAGIWFNRIAQVNGAWVTALINQPAFDKMPIIMEEVKRMRTSSSKELSGAEVFNPYGSGADSSTLVSELKGMHADAARMSTVLYSAYKYWRADQMNFDRGDKSLNSGALETAMNMIFGTYGLFSMTGENVQTHPLAQLATLGRGLVEASIRNIAVSTGSAALGGVAGALNRQAGSLVQAAGQFFNSVAFLGLTVGLVLFYVVPFLPFVYFYFAVASWIKTIFESMVGVPLWALAHLRLDGDGLPGDSASNGYFLIFEIFLRPILTVFGLMAAMVIFTAQVRILNFTWMIVTENAGGFNTDTQIAAVAGKINLQRSIVDQFFFTVTYAIVVYMMATAAFKLVDTIPDNILRWAGQGVSSFGDINQDPTGELTRYAALGGMTAGREATAGLQQLGQGLGGAAGGLARTGQGLGGALKNPFGS